MVGILKLEIEQFVFTNKETNKQTNKRMYIMKRGIEGGQIVVELACPIVDMSLEVYFSS